jgi:hypothetical protein
MTVPAMRPANEVVVSSSRSCETIRAEIAAHTACGNPEITGYDRQDGLIQDDRNDAGAGASNGELNCAAEGRVRAE